MTSHTPASPALSPAAVKSAICRECCRLTRALCGHSLRAIVLTGSLARDEASFSFSGDACTVLSDAEFLLVFHEGAARPVSVEELCRQIENALSALGIAVPVTMGGMAPADLRALPAHVFTYELKRCGQTVWGDPDVLLLVPEFPSTSISREDAWRMLNNRMVELLEASVRLWRGRASLPPEVFHRTVKLYLDMATSFLVFQKAYAPSYRQRAASLQALAERAAGTRRGPFDSLMAFSERVGKCTERKLQGGSFGEDFSFWQHALDDARRLWEWELRELTGGGRTLSGLRLLQRWTESQPLRLRLRGWAYVMRRCGWHRSWRCWPRWARACRHGSPRYRIYAAAAALLFRLPALIESSQPWNEERPWRHIVSLLPVAGPGLLSGRREWQTLAAEIAANYHQFLERTTA